MWQGLRRSNDSHHVAQLTMPAVLPLNVLGSGRVSVS